MPRQSDLWAAVAFADDEHLAAHVAAGGGLGGAGVVEEGFGFFEDGGEVFAFEDFHAEVAARGEDFGKEFEDATAETSREEVVAVACGVWGHVAEDDVEISGDAFEVRGWVEGEGVVFEDADGGAEGMIDVLEVDAENEPVAADFLFDDLEPGTWGASEVENHVASAEESPFFVDFDELVGGAGEIAVGLGLLEVVVVEFSGLGHGEQ